VIFRIVECEDRIADLQELRPRTRDFGGCRCQAFLLTGDAAATDPVCLLAPLRTSWTTFLRT